MNYTLEDAEKALKIVADKFGKELAAQVEQVARLETGHFSSLQFKNCGTGGWKPTEKPHTTDGIKRSLFRTPIIYRLEYSSTRRTKA